MAAIVIGGHAVQPRPNIVHFQHLHKKSREFMDACLVVAVEQVRVMMGNHRGAGAGRNHDILGPFEDFEKVPRHVARLLAIPAVEGRLAAACLRLAKLDLAAGALQHFRHGHSDPRKYLVHNAGDKNRNPGLRQTSISPSRNFTAFPAMVTRSPRSSHHSCPPRFEICRANNFVLPRRFDQYGTRVQCADPVAGSSGTPLAGAKKRETKSQSRPGAVTMIPNRSIAASFSMFGEIPRTSSSVSNTHR